jgi:hypothetical protein
MEQLNSHMEQQSIQWRRDKVQELSSQGNSQREISKILQVGIGTVNRDLSYLRQQSKNNIRRYIDERLPEDYEKCLVGLTAILREAWNTSQQTEDKRDDAIRFVAEKSKEKLKSSFCSSNDKLKESDYDEYKNQVEENQEEETGESTAATVNQVF